MKIPLCHYPPCKKREMILANETPEFWTFACRCGTIRALSKPSTRAASNYAKTQNQIEELRRIQKAKGIRTAFSFPSALGTN